MVSLLASLGAMPPAHSNGNTHPFNSDDLALVLGILGSILLMWIVTMVVIVVLVRRRKRARGGEPGTSHAVMVVDARPRGADGRDLLK